MYSYKENYLIHFGVPGMKWGQRKNKVYSRDITKKNPKKIHKKLSKMSKKEICKYE